MNKLIEIKNKKKPNLNFKKYKYLLQFLPKSLEEISQSKFTKDKLKTSYLIDIIHNLLLKYYFKKENSFNLSSIILKEKYGYRYNYYIKFLLEKEFILLVKNHQKGKNSRIYKLNDNIINNDIIRYKNTDTILLKKYTNYLSTDNTNYNSILLPVKSKLVSDLYSVKIDYAKSIFFLDSTMQDIDIYNKNRYSVDCIMDNHIFYHFDDYGRIHTNFTILKSFIRKNCLLIDGDVTFEKDIVNSQPLFLCKLINDNDVLIVNNKEFNLFKKLTISGKFYQYIMDNCNYNDKKMAKEMVYKVFFGKNYSNNKHDVNFKYLFPTIYSFIKAYKREMKDYRSLAYYLQREESNFVFNKVIKTIMNLYPDVKLITVHDSIVCANKYRDILEIIFNQKMKEEFQFIYS